MKTIHFVYIIYYMALQFMLFWFTDLIKADRIWSVCIGMYAGFLFCLYTAPFIINKERK